MTMRKTSLLFIVIVSMLSLASCVKQVNRVALEALANVENMSFNLVEMTWEGDTPILSVNTDYGNADYNILWQRETSTRYMDMVQFSGYGLQSSSGRYDKNTDGYSGGLSICQIVCEYDTLSDLSQKPSDVFIKEQYFGTFFISIPYTVSKNGDIEFGEYVYQGQKNNTTNEREHLNCHVDSFSPEQVVVVFEDYLLPDFSTDSFRTGKVKMVFRNSLY